MNDEQSIPVTVRLSPDQVTRLDDWRRAQSDLPGRPEAIRRILDDRLIFQSPHVLQRANQCVEPSILSWQNHHAASLHLGGST